MLFDPPLVRATLLRRYKRFLADIAFPDGTLATAHCCNPGAMLGAAAPGSAIWVQPAAGKGRKLAWSWKLVEADDTLVGIDTSLPNRLAAEALVGGAIPELGGYDRMRREVRYGVDSRVDLLLESDERPPCLVEVKNVQLMRHAGIIEFPDCVTKRGTKHLTELARIAAGGGRAVMLYVAQRADGEVFRIAGDLDPAYAAAFATARAAGVEAYCYGCSVRCDGIAVARRLRIEPCQPINGSDGGIDRAA